MDRRFPWEDDGYGLEVLESPWYMTLACLQDIFVKSSMEFFSNKEFLYLPLPMTTGAVSSPMGLGSDSVPVKVTINGRETYLADSMQFLLEYACRWASKGSFYLMPSFRGESTDERHLSQFFHSEVEMLGTLDDVMDLAEEYLIYLCRSYLIKARDEIEEIAGTTEHLGWMASHADIPRVSLAQALDILSDKPGCVDTLAGGHRIVNAKGEAELMEHFGGCLWLTRFDSATVPFYQASDDGIARNADLLMGIGETLGAGERHSDAKHLRESLRAHQVEEDAYRWYVEMKEAYPMTTSGFGMGMERFLLWLLKHDDIRDCQIVARMDGAAMAP